jgi:hypothetical protein
VPVCTMTRVSDIRKDDLCFDEHNNLIGTDWDFWIRLSVHVQFGYLDKLTCKYRIHNSNITRTTGSVKRKHDDIYRRLKIMNSGWFNELSTETRSQFFLDLLTNALSGDAERQHAVLRSEQCAELPFARQADLWRIAGIDVLKNSRNSDEARLFVVRSRELDRADHKTWVLLRLLGLGAPLALAVVSIWHRLVLARGRMGAMRNGRSAQLQKLLGAK